MTEPSEADDAGEIRPRSRLRLVVGGIGLVVFAVSFSILVWGDDLLAAATAARFGTVAPPPSFGKPRDQAEADRQDLVYLAEFAKLDASLTTETGAAFEAERQALLARAGALTPAELRLGVAHAVARAGNLGSNVDFTADPAALNRLAIRLRWFAEGLFVIAVRPDFEALLGARIETIDGKTPEELAAAWRPYRGGGSDAGARLAGTWFLQSPAALAAAGIGKESQSAVIRYIPEGGSAQEATVPALSGPDAQRAEGWHDLVQTKPPLSLQEPDRAVFAKTLGDGLYLRLDRESGDANPVSRLAAALTGDQNGKLNWIVLDLRGDADAGDLAIERTFRSLPGRLTTGGRLFILTGPLTGDGAIAIAARLKAALGSRLVIEGEPVGDRLQFWSGAGAEMRLPNSGIAIRYATAWHDFQDGCRSLACYWPDLVDGAAVGDLTPGVIVHGRFSDYRQGVDTALQRLAEMTRVPELGGRPGK